MSERSVALLLTLAFFLLVLVWIPFLDALARFSRRHRQRRYTKKHRKQMEADLPNLYAAAPPFLVRQNGQKVRVNNEA